MGLIKQQFIRGRKIASTIGVVVGGFHTAYRLDAFKKPPRDKLPQYIQNFCRKACQAIGVEVVQLEPVVQRHGLWVSNHVSWMDIPVIGSISPAFFLSKAEIAEWPIIGALVRAGGTLFIHRGSGDANAVSNQIAEFLREGSSVVFFPEATTTDGHAIKKVHGKLLQAAIDTGVPIQPVVLCYINEKGELSDEIPYYGKMTMADSLKKVLDSKKSKAYVLPLEEINPEGKTRSELTELVQLRLSEGLARLHAAATYKSAI